MLQGVDGIEIHVRLFVVAGQYGRAQIALVHRRTRLERQAIAAYVLGPELYNPHERVGPVALGLAGQAVDEVDADVVEPGLTRGCHGELGLLPVVAAAYELEYVVVRALHAHGEAVETLFPELGELSERGAVGVDLHRDLAVLEHAAAALELIPELEQALGSIVAGRSAAKVHGVDIPALERRIALAYVLHERVLVLRHQPVAPGERVEVAVRALRDAERYVDVYAESVVH